MYRPTNGAGDRPKRLALGLIALLAATIVAVFATGAYAGDAGFSVNESGQTYGSAFVDVNGSPAPQPYLPDLVLASTSEGRTGYYYQADKEAAREQWANRTFEQMEADELSNAEALVNASAEIFGVELLTPEDALNYVKNHNIGGQEDACRRVLLESMGKTASQIDERGDALAKGVTLEGVDQMIDSAREATAIRIPMYLSDGKTGIGDYLITTL